MPAADSKLDAAWRTVREEPLAVAFFTLAWAIGLAFRLGSSGLIEYKGDEGWMFRTTENILHGGGWPAVGMPSSVGLVNPGLSLWIFPVLGRLSGATTPTGLARAVQLMSCAALTLLLLFACSRPKGERGLWLWTGALAAVDPIGIVLQRKIWAQSTLPLFVLLAFLGWRARGRIAGAFCWGLFGALVGQIHMSGFLYAPLSVLWAIWANVRRTNRVRTRWWAWLTGSVLGAVPLVPWLLYLWHGGAGARVSDVHRPLYWGLWITDALGWNLDYSLGSAHLRRFEEMPYWNGQPTHLVQASLVAVGVIAAVLCLALIWRTFRQPREVLAGLAQEDAVAFNLAFVAYGLVITVAGINLFRHYLLIAFPFEAMTLPLLVWLGGRRWGWLMPVWLAHVFVVVLLRQYLIAHHGAPGGDFGIAYEFQGHRF